MQIKWSASALKDLDNELEYLASSENGDIDLAQKVYAHIRRSVSKLAEFTEIGKKGRVFGTRELIVSKYPYIVPYRVKNNCVEILALFHTKSELLERW